MIALLDVNLLVALAWPQHVHHTIAQRWFADHDAEGWATCPATQAGFVRVSSNFRVIPEAKSPQEAFRHLDRIVALDHHVFWPDDVSLTDRRLVVREKIRGYRQVTDAHLLAVALRHGGCLATLDGGIRQLLPGPESDRRVILVG